MPTKPATKPATLTVSRILATAIEDCNCVDSITYAYVKERHAMLTEGLIAQCEFDRFCSDLSILNDIT